MNLLQGLQEEITRNREILKMYEEIPEGVFGSIMIKRVINKADKAIDDGDVIAMLASLAELKETE